MDHAKDEKGNVVGLQCEADVGGVEDYVADRVDGTASSAVGDVGDEGGSDSLDYLGEG